MRNRNFTKRGDLIKMIIETKFGKFEIIKDYRNSFDLAKFEERYIEEVFNNYTYIVGDIAYDILRLKGFSVYKDCENSYNKIADYLDSTCNYNCKYYILKKIDFIEPKKENKPRKVIRLNKKRGARHAKRQNKKKGRRNY